MHKVIKIMNNEFELSLIGVGFTFRETDNNFFYWEFVNMPDEILFPCRGQAIEAAAHQAGKLLDDQGIYAIDRWEALTEKDKLTMLRLHAHQFTSN